MHHWHLPPRFGKDFFREEEITHLKPYQVAKKGIARTFQNIELFSHMSTMDNLMLGRHIHMKTGVWMRCHLHSQRFKGSQRGGEHREKVEEIIDFLEFQVARNQFVVNLPYGTRKLVELGRALALGPGAHPLGRTLGWNEYGRKRRPDVLDQDIRDDLGITVLLVEHDMNLIMDVSDRILSLELR